MLEHVTIRYLTSDLKQAKLRDHFAPFLWHMLGSVYTSRYTIVAAAKIQDHETGLISGSFSWFQSRQIIRDSHETESTLYFLVFFHIFSKMEAETKTFSMLCYVALDATDASVYVPQNSVKKVIELLSRSRGLVKSRQKMGETLSLVRLMLARKLQPLIH